MNDPHTRRDNLLAPLEGITYNDWRMVSLTVNRYFEIKEGELKRQLRLPGVEDLRNITL